MYKKISLSGILRVLFSSEHEEVAHTAGVTPLVVVPGNQLDEFVIQLNTGGGIEDGGSSVADKVGGDNSLVGVLDDALERTIGGLLDGVFDLFVGCALVEADDEVNDGDIEGGNTEREATGRLNLGKKGQER